MDSSKKRKLSDAGFKEDSATAAVPEWQPAPGESPAEREKRIKREKRAAKMGLSVGNESGWSNGQQSSASHNAHPPPPLSTPAPTSSSTTGEWQPAPGESPAEREKRIKREKRAARLGVPVESLTASSTSTVHQSSSSYHTSSNSNNNSNNNKYDYSVGYGGEEEGYGDGLPSTTTYASATTGGTTGAAAIHPSRLATAPKLAKEASIGVPKEKTKAKLKYLRKKKARAKGKKASAPKSGGNEEGAKDDGEVEGDTASGSDDDDDSDEDGDSQRDKDKKEEAEKKKQEILRKKEERKIKRDAKKAEIRRLKAEGKDVSALLPPSAKKVAPTQTVPAPSPTKVTATKIVKAPEPDVEMELVRIGPTQEELEAIEEDKAKQARKEAKRLKRIQRRLESPDTPVRKDDQAEAEEQDGKKDEVEKPAEEEPAPLLRLPSGTKPAPPSAKTLSSLTVHASVRNKQVVDPELKVALDDPVLGLSERGRTKLAEMGVMEAFAVQTAVFPLLLNSECSHLLYPTYAPPRDLCVSAPTGSGKTLSYVVPIAESLQRRVVTRLRALVVLPTRDLVPQVRDTFETYCKGTGLKIGTITGAHSFAHEQSLLVGENVDESLQGGSSTFDILISTPGRLMDHIQSTKGFSLQHLRYLVIDEADRLLTQSFQDWLPSILNVLKPPASLSPGPSPAESDAVAPDWWSSSVAKLPSDVNERCLHSCQKLLFSATLSRDPAKIDALHLTRPIFISVEDAIDGAFDDDHVDDELKFTLPATLSEFMIISPSTHKPLYLFHLLHTLSLTSALCFTKSVEAATRLAKLVSFFEAEWASANPEAKKVAVHTYSSDLTPNERNKVLASFKKGEIQMLICSDLIARGIDLPDVSHVISYDIPTDMRRYVHRVGRTARAGKIGDAWSLVEDQEAAPFRTIMRAGQHYDKISRVRVADPLVEPFVPHYQIALDKLRVLFAKS
ncbi:DEAD-domain-containing protein [Meredithblackwellia eburnea MCA 4105]